MAVVDHRVRLKHVHVYQSDSAKGSGADVKAAK